MKKQTLFVTIAAALCAIGTACQKDKQHKSPNRAVVAGTTALCADTVATATLSGVISANTTLFSNTVYYLSGLVYVSGGATLTIQPGTIIRGLPGTTGVPGGGLIITRGSKIDAQGTASCPIVFTSYRQPAGTAESGDWAGVIILGSAPIHTETGATTAMIEGVPDNPPASAEYGGSNASDNSGILTYVRIEYAGFELSTDNEINGLTLGGVGCGTTLEHIEVYKSKDDSFEFFGGTVNAKWLVSVDGLDDMFDFDFGYSGHIQYALGLSDPNRADKSQSNGIESDNDKNGTTNTPQTLPEIANLTIIGVSNATLAQQTNLPPSGTGSYGRGAHFRRNSGYKLVNSILLGFKWGVHLDNSSASVPGSINKLNTSEGCFENNLVHGYLIAFNWATPPSASASNTGVTGAVPASWLNDPFNRTTPDFALPAAGSPALSSSFYSACLGTGACSFSFLSTDYKGAFGTTNWATDIIDGGWVKY